VIGNIYTTKTSDISPVGDFSSVMLFVRCQHYILTAVKNTVCHHHHQYGCNAWCSRSAVAFSHCDCPQETETSAFCQSSKPITETITPVSGRTWWIQVEWRLGLSCPRFQATYIIHMADSAHLYRLRTRFSTVYDLLV